MSFSLKSVNPNGHKTNKQLSESKRLFFQAFNKRKFDMANDENQDLSIKILLIFNK